MESDEYTQAEIDEIQAVMDDVDWDRLVQSMVDQYCDDMPRPL